MGAVRTSAYVAEDVAIDEHVYVNDAGEPKGWLYLGTGHDVALWGSPAGLRRVAAALVLLAERADSVGVLRYAANGNGGDGLRDRAGVSGVRGS